MDQNWDDVFREDEAVSCPSVDNDVDLDPSVFLDGDNPPDGSAERGPLEHDETAFLLSEGEDEVGTGLTGVSLQVSSSSSRRKGRPHGSVGGALLRERLRAARDVIQSRHDAAQPQPGSIEYARAHKRKAQPEIDESDDHCMLVPATAITTSLLEQRSPIWACMQGVGSTIIQGMVDAAVYSVQRQTPEARASSDVAKVISLKSEAIMTDKALKSALVREGASGSIDIRQNTSLAASACVLAGGAAWSGCMEAIRQQSLQDKLKQRQLRPVFWIEKVRYDETPLRVRIAEPASSAVPQAQASESYPHAKVFQTEQTLGMVVEHMSTRRLFLICGRSPTHLQTADHNTSECILHLGPKIITRLFLGIAA